MPFSVVVEEVGDPGLRPEVEFETCDLAGRFGVRDKLNRRFTVQGQDQDQDASASADRLRLAFRLIDIAFDGIQPFAAKLREFHGGMSGEYRGLGLTAETVAVDCRCNGATLSVHPGMDEARVVRIGASKYSRRQAFEHSGVGHRF